MPWDAAVALRKSWDAYVHPMLVGKSAEDAQKALYASTLVGAPLCITQASRCDLSPGHGLALATTWHQPRPCPARPGLTPWSPVCYLLLCVCPTLFAKHASAFATAEQGPRARWAFGHRAVGVANCMAHCAGSVPWCAKCHSGGCCWARGDIEYGGVESEGGS